MPPLIRRSRSAVPGTPAGTAVTQALGPTRRRDMTPPVMLRARLFEHIPLREYGEPEEFGWAGAFVLSPAASRITGAMIPVDGGAISSI